MSREKTKTKRNCESKSSKGGKMLPDDQVIANRYIGWKNLLDKYNHSDEDDDGLSIEDALQVYQMKDGDGKEYEQTEEALECSEDDEDKACSKSDYTALKHQLTVAVKERNKEWKNNGMEEIFNSNFSIGVDYVQKWLTDCEHGTGRQVTQERETRFTEHNGKLQMDVTCRENISILNQTDRKQLTSEHCSNYDFCNTDQRRIIVHQVEKTTISSFLTVDSGESNGTGGAIPKLPQDSFIGNISTFTPFKLPIRIESLKPLAGFKDRNRKQQQAERTSAFDSGTLSSLMENSLKIVPKSRVVNDMQNKTQKHNPKRRVHFKAPKKKRRYIIESSESSDSEQSDDKEEKWSASVPKPTRSVPVVRGNRKEQPTICRSSRSDSSDSSLCETKAVSPPLSVPSLPAGITMKRVDETNASLSHTGNGDEKPPNGHQQPAHSQNAKKYPMPANYRQMLSVNGRCPYKTDGTIIYRPKPIHQGLPREAEKILLQTQDLDLSGIKSNLRRKKFDNFARQTHPNSVLVYYMSDTDDELFDTMKVRDSDEDSSDEDDPILSFKPQLCVLTFFNDGTQTS